MIFIIFLLLLTPGDFLLDVKKIVDDGNKSLYWITSYFDRGNFDDCNKYLNQAKDKAKELVAFSNDPLVKVGLTPRLFFNF